MPHPRSATPRGWLFALLVALTFFVTLSALRLREVERLRSAVEFPAVIDPNSPTGYAGGIRFLISPQHNNESYQWLMQTQAMFARGEWRLRHADYDNAPQGRSVLSPSLYRWYLGGLAWLDHLVTSEPIGLCVERAALWADPLLFGLFLVGATCLLAQWFGPLAATVFPILAGAMYPFAGAFLPGAPEDTGVTVLCLILCAVCLLAGLRSEHARSTRRLFALSAIFGAFGLWLNVGLTFPTILALTAGAMLGSWLQKDLSAASLPWRIWSSVGALTSLVFWFLEYAPSHLDWSAGRLNENHAVYALAWWGGGELICFTRALFQRQSQGLSPRTVARAAVGLAAVAVLPTMMIQSGAPAFLELDTYAGRLTALGEPLESAHLFQMFAQTGPLQGLAVGAPMLLLALSLWRLLTCAPRQRLELAIAVLPALVSLAFAIKVVSWWNAFGALLIVSTTLVCATLRPPSPPASKANLRSTLAPDVLRTGLVASVVFVVSIGLTHYIAALRADLRAESYSEQIALAERDFAHWLARRTGESSGVVLAPPHLTVSLAFHGGMRGIGSPYKENADGFLGSVRIAGATVAYEAQALIGQRQITHIAMPSWDDYLVRYAELGANKSEHSLVGLLNRWLPPRWLKPVAYQLPATDAFSSDRLVLFEVTEVQDNAEALGRLTEYFVDMGQTRLAGLAAQALEADFSSDLGAQLAKARSDALRGDRTAFIETLDSILLGLQEGADETLDWDRRVSLCILLAEANKVTEAREQARRCLETVTEMELRQLPGAALFRFLTLCRALDLRIDDASLRRLSVSLLPPALRSSVQ